MHNLEETIKEMIDSYCYRNLKDRPENDEQYIQYAKRLQQVALINMDELNEFISSINDKQLQS